MRRGFMFLALGVAFGAMSPAESAAAGKLGNRPRAPQELIELEWEPDP